MLTFDAESHTYRWDDEVVPSVTQVLESEQELDGIPPAILEAAREFGTHVHLACHYHDTDELDFDGLSESLKPYVTAWMKFRKLSGARVLSSEVPAYNQDFGFAGTPDKLLLWNRDEWTIDLKSGEVPATVGPQTAAYDSMILPKSKRRRRRGCVQLKHTGEFQFFELNDRRDMYVFISALNLWKWRRHRGNIYGNRIDVFA